VRGAVLLGRTHVEHDHVSGTDALDQPLLVDRLESAPLLDEGVRDLLDLGKPRSPSPRRAPKKSSTD
jgi:hypothetical protein